MTSLSLGSNSYHDDDDDNDVDDSLLVSPTKNSNNDCSAFAEEEMKGNAEQDIFKNGIGDDDNIKENSGYGGDKRSIMMDDTFQDDSLVVEDDATTPAKRKFSYAAAMEQLDDSWLAPTPAKPSRKLNDNEESDDSNESFGGELSIMEEEERFETEVVDDDGVGSNNLAERWSESPLKDDSLRQQEEMDNVDNNDTEAISSPGVAALVPAPPKKQTSSPPEAEVAAGPQQINDDSILSSPNIESSTVTTTSNNIFRHTSIHQHDHNDDTDNKNYQLHLGHPINESYDSVEQQKLHAQQQQKNCISGFLVDRDRVTNEIVCLNNNDDDNTKNDDSFDDDSLIVDNEESYNKSVLEETTLEDHPEMNDEQEAEEEEGLTLEEETSLEEHPEMNVEHEAEIEEEEEEGLTLTQAADCTTDSDGFLKKIEHSFLENNEDLVNDDHDDVVASLQQDDNNLALDKDGMLNTSDNAAVAAEDNKDDEKGVVNKYHLSSPSDSEVNVPESVSPVVEGDTSGVERVDEEYVEVKSTELTSSRGDSLTFSTSGDAANDTTLELDEVQNAIHSSEVVVRNNDSDPTHHDTATEQMVGGDVGDDNLDYSTSNDQLSNVKAGTDLSFEDQNSLSASLDVSLSNIDREALFSGAFAQQLSPIRQNSSSPRDLSQHQEEDADHDLSQHQEEDVDHDLSQHQEGEDVDDGENDDEIQLPAILDTSPISESSSPHDCRPLLGANLCAEEEERNIDRIDDKVGGVLAVGESVEGSPSDSVEEDNKGSIFAVLSQVNTSSNEVIHETLPRDEEDGGIGKFETSYSDISGVDESKESDREEAQMMNGQASPIETFAGRDNDAPSPKEDYELDERNKSLEDLSSYQHTFSSTSTAFLERLRGAAESRKREVTKARQSMERKEQFLYEEKEEREVMPTLSEVAEETVEEPENRTSAVVTKAFKSRALPASNNTSEQVPWRSTSMRGSKRKSPTSSQPHIGENRAYGTNNMAINARPPKRLLSGESASYAKEMNRKKLLQEDDERIQRDSVFKARPLPATTLPRGHKGGMEQRRNRPNNSRVPRAGKENSAFKPSSSARAEERAAYNEERKAREDARRHEQIRKRNAIINETSEEIEKLKRLI